MGRSCQFRRSDQVREKLSEVFCCRILGRVLLTPALLAPSPGSGCTGGSVAVPGTHAGVPFSRVWLPRPLAKGGGLLSGFSGRLRSIREVGGRRQGRGGLSTLSGHSGPSFPYACFAYPPSLSHMHDEHFISCGLLVSAAGTQGKGEALDNLLPFPASSVRHGGRKGGSTREDHDTQDNGWKGRMDNPDHD